MLSSAATTITAALPSITDNHLSSLKITPVISNTNTKHQLQHHSHQQHHSQQQHQVVTSNGNGHIAINFTTNDGVIAASSTPTITTNASSMLPINLNHLNVSQSSMGVGCQGLQIISTTTTAPTTTTIINNNNTTKLQLNGNGIGVKHGVVRKQTISESMAHHHQANNNVHHQLLTSNGGGNTQITTTTNQLKDGTKILSSSKCDAEPPTKVLKLLNGIALTSVVDKDNKLPPGALTLSQVGF